MQYLLGNPITSFFHQREKIDNIICERALIQSSNLSYIKNVILFTSLGTYMYSPLPTLLCSKETHKGQMRNLIGKEGDVKQTLFTHEIYIYIP